MYICLFVCVDSLHPINNLSAIMGQVFLGCTSTKLWLMFLLKDTTQWRRRGSNLRPLGLKSSTLQLSHCAPCMHVYHHVTVNKILFKPKFILLIKVKKANNCWHFNFYEQDKFWFWAFLAFISMMNQSFKAREILIHKHISFYEHLTLPGLVKNNWALPHIFLVWYCRQQMWLCSISITCHRCLNPKW